MPKSLRSRRPLVQAALAAALSLLAAPAFAQSLSLLDARVVEGNNGMSMLVFEARLSAPAPGPVSFDFDTTGAGSAVPPDYMPLGLDGLSIPVGKTSLKISLPVYVDTTVEPNENVEVALSNVSGATLADGTAQGLIVNDDHMMLVSAPADPGAQTGSTGLASGTPALSSDGRFVAFTSTARDLVPGRPGNVVQNVYVRDNRTGLTTLASVAANGGDTNSDCNSPALSADGRFVVFQCYASNLVAGDTNTMLDIYRRDLLTGTTSLVSVNSAGSGAAGGFSSGPQISADGRYIAFQSTASDLVAVDTNNNPDVFVRDMDAGTTMLASTGPDGVDSDPAGAWMPALSADGRYAVYSKGANEVWRRDMQTGVAVRASVSTSGGTPNSSSYAKAVSADGRYVLFSSWATDLGGPAVMAYPQVWVRDVQAGTTELVSVSQVASMSLDSGAYDPSISDDGRYVAFDSNARASADDSDGSADVFVRDLQADTTVRVSKPWTGASSAGDSSTLPKISGDGRFVAFMNPSTQLLPGDDNGQDDVFRVEVPQDASLPALTLQDWWVVEGDDGTQMLNLFIDLGGATASVPVRFDIATADGTAEAGSDYEALYLFGQTIPVGQTSATVTLEIKGDLENEMDEGFNLYLGNVSGARLVDGHSVVIIGDNDEDAPPPFLSVGNAGVIEGHSGTQQAGFTVSLSEPSDSPVSFVIATADGTAVAGSDYVASEIVLTIPAGSTSVVFYVNVIGDRMVEEDEQYLVRVSNVTGAIVADGEGGGAIANDDLYPLLTVADVAISEGDSGTRQATFTVSLNMEAPTPVSFDIATADYSAIAGVDYVGRALTSQTIPAGASSTTFSVAINGDLDVEPNELFHVNVSNVVGAYASDGHAMGTITNDDVQPSLSIGDVSIVEGNGGTRLATFTVQLSAPAKWPVGYSVSTANGTAIAPGDYTAMSLNGQSIPVGATSASFAVSINSDLGVEPTESFMVNVSNVTGASVSDSQALGTIVNDDTLPALTIADVSITEGQNSSRLATFTVSLSSAATGPVTFNIATANGTAVAPGDYTAKSASAQSIPAGVLEKFFTVSVRGDKQVEASETFFVNVSSVSANVAVADGQAVGTIVNDDGAMLSLSRVTTGGLYDDVDDRRGDPVLSAKEYALLLLDSAQQVCARADGASVVAVDGVESAAVLAELADIANNLCARRPSYSAVMKAGELGFLVDGAAGKANPHGPQVLELAAQGAKLRTSSLTVLADGHARPLTVLLAATPSTVASERAAQAAELNRLVRARLASDPHARLVVLGAAGLDGLVDLTARSLPAGVAAAERVWVSNAVLAEFDGVRLDIPAAPRGKPAQQVLRLQP